MICARFSTLVAGDAHRFLVFFRQNELRELRRTGHIVALADIDEIGLRGKRERVNAAEPQVGLDLGDDARLSGCTAVAIFF